VFIFLITLRLIFIDNDGDCLVKNRLKPIFSRQDAKAQRKPRAIFKALSRETDYRFFLSA